MTTINFNKSNRVDDPGVDLEPAEVAARFWASDDAKEWLTSNGGMRLERVALGWVSTHLGGWDPDDQDIWPLIYGALFDARPWAGTDNVWED